MHTKQTLLIQYSSAGIQMTAKPLLYTMNTRGCITDEEADPEESIYVEPRLFPYRGRGF